MATRRGTRFRQNIRPSLSNTHETERYAVNGRQNVRASHSSAAESECDVSNLLDDMHKQMREQKEHLKSLSSSYDFMSDSFDTLQGEIKKLAKENKQIKKDVAMLKSSERELVKRIQMLEKNSVKSKQDDNGNHMIITNLPKFDEHTNLREVVVKISEQVSYPVTQDVVVDVYQNENKQQQNKTYPIIVRLRSPELKIKCMEFRKNKKTIDIKAIIPNASNQTTNVNFHHLVEKEYASLLKKAKDAARTKQYKYVWIKNSTILVRKSDDSEIIKIHDVGELSKIV